jgi:hypothetical protein
LFALEIGSKSEKNTSQKKLEKNYHPKHIENAIFIDNP